MELRELEAFVAVAQEHGVRAAAAALNVDPATVSRAISRLERSLGTSLLVRQAGGVALTPAGKLFLGEARAALVHAGRASLLARHASAAARTAGERPIVVGIPPIPAVPEVDQVLTHVRRAIGSRPYIFRRLSWREDFSGERVRAGAVDIAVSVLPGPAEHLTAVALKSVPRAVALPLDHKLGAASLVTPDELDDMNAVAPSPLRGEALAFWTLDPQANGKPRRLTRRPKSVSELLRQIAGGRGFMTLPVFVPVMWQRSDLTFRRLQAPPCAVGLVWDPDHIDPSLRQRLVGRRPVQDTARPPGPVPAIVRGESTRH